MFYYYEMEFGKIIFNDEIEDIEQAITYLGDRKLTEQHLNTILTGKDFCGNDGKYYNTKGNAEKIFTEFIPRVLGKKSKIKKVKTLQEVLSDINNNDES